MTNVLSFIICKFDRWSLVMLTKRINLRFWKHTTYLVRLSSFIGPPEYLQSAKLCLSWISVRRVKYPMHQWLNPGRELMKLVVKFVLIECLIRVLCVQMKVLKLFIAMASGFILMTGLVVGLVKDHDTRRTILGVLGATLALAMYSAPLTVMVYHYFGHALVPKLQIILSRNGVYLGGC